MKKLDIKRALAEHNMSQVELARRSGVNPPNISAIIKEGNPTIARLTKIAEGIGCDITDLFYPDPAEEAKEEEMPMEAEKENATAEIPATNEAGYLLHSNGLVIEGQGVSTENEPQGGAAKVETFCPHCGKKVRVGVVLLGEQC